MAAAVPSIESSPKVNVGAECAGCQVQIARNTDFIGEILVVDLFRFHKKPEFYQKVIASFLLHSDNMIFTQSPLLRGDKLSLQTNCDWVSLTGGLLRHANSPSFLFIITISLSDFHLQFSSSTLRDFHSYLSLSTFHFFLFIIISL